MYGFYLVRTEIDQQTITHKNIDGSVIENKYLSSMAIYPKYSTGE